MLSMRNMWTVDTCELGTHLTKVHRGRGRRLWGMLATSDTLSRELKMDLFIKEIFQFWYAFDHGMTQRGVTKHRTTQSVRSIFAKIEHGSDLAVIFNQILSVSSQHKRTEGKIWTFNRSLLFEIWVKSLSTGRELQRVVLAQTRHQALSCNLRRAVAL